MSTREIKFDVDYVIHEYTVSKRAILDIAREIGVGRGVITRRLNKIGFTFRTPSEASLASARRFTPEQRSARVKNAHEAKRGVKQSRETKLKRAKTVESKSEISSGLEKMVYQSMLERGIDFTPQTAVGIYNVDFTIGTIAVEIFGGGWHFSGRAKDRHFDRCIEVINSGYTMIILNITNANPFTNTVADDLASKIKSISTDKTIRGENWMVWGTFDCVTTFGLDSVNESLIRPFVHTRDGISGRYKCITR